MTTRNKGFTLIELVVVIVILGILAVTAAPRFLNLQEDANEAAIQGAKGAMVSAISLFHAKWLIDGEPDPDNPDGREGDWGYTIYELHYNRYGYPRVISSNDLQLCDVIFTRLINSSDFTSDDFSFKSVGGGAGNKCIYTFKKSPYEMTYTEATGEVTLTKV